MIKNKYGYYWIYKFNKLSIKTYIQVIIMVDTLGAAMLNSHKLKSPLISMRLGDTLESAFTRRRKISTKKIDQKGTFLKKR